MRILLKERIAEYNAHCRRSGAPLMNQKRLASIVGVKQGAVSEHAAGKREPKLDLLCRYAQALQCDISALIPPLEDSTGHTVPHMGQNCNPLKSRVSR